jgi:transaldolase
VKSLYEQLVEMTIAVADTGEIDAIEQYRPRDATTNPSLIAAAAQMPAYQPVVDEALRFTRGRLGPSAARTEVAKAAVDRLSVEFGLRILKIVPGRVSTEVDARLSYDTQATIEKAHTLIAEYEAAGASRDRVLIKVASTWEGIRAAERLEKEGIHCNLTLLFGIHQAIACAEAGVTLISPFVGRILDWYKKETGRDYPAEEDPGVVSVKRIYEYYKHFGFKTEVMGASFRTLGEIRELAGCDLLTIAPKFLAELHQIREPLPRKLDPEAAKRVKVERIDMSERAFRDLHQQDRMANDKLAEGIVGFSKSIEALESQLAERLAALEA